MLDQPELSPESKIRQSYRAFLLRCWQETADGGATWRFTLVQLGTQSARRGFASLEDLADHLRQELANIKELHSEGD